MNKYLYPCIICILLLISTMSCSTESAPGCNDDKTKSLAIKSWAGLFETRVKVFWLKFSEPIFGKFKGNLSDVKPPITREELIAKMSIHIENITTLEYRKEIGTYVCSGDLIYELKDNIRSVPWLKKGEKTSRPLKKWPLD